MTLALGLAVAVLAGSGCAVTRQPAGPPDWLAWRAKRHESIGGTNGWSTLVGLNWLAEGRQSIGAAPTNDLVLEAVRVPARIGWLERHGREVSFEPAAGVPATVDGQPVSGAVGLRSDAGGAPSRLKVGDVTFTVIQRNERTGLRARDPGAPARLHFAGLPCFPYQPEWRIAGRFEPYQPPRELTIDDVTGNTQPMVCPGVLVFQAGGQECRLDAVREPGEESLFVIFRDQTAGVTTYPAGRFLYVDPPDGSGRVVLDLNRAYTPPCGFTAFATCPLPPRQNRLPIAIPAGERKPPGH